MSQNLLQAVLDVLSEHEPDMDDAVDVLLDIVTRIAVDQGWELSVLADLPERMMDMVDKDQRAEARLQ